MTHYERERVNELKRDETEFYKTRYAWRFKGIKDEREVIMIEGWLSDYNIDFNPNKLKKTMLQHIVDMEPLYASSHDVGVWVKHLKDMKGLNTNQCFKDLFYKTTGRDILVVRVTTSSCWRESSFADFNAHMMWKDYGDWHDAKYILFISDPSDDGSWYLSRAVIKDSVLQMSGEKGIKIFK